MPLWKASTYTCKKDFSTFAAGSFHSFKVGDEVPESVVRQAKNRSMLMSKRFIVGEDRDQYRRDRAHKQLKHTPFYPPGAGPWTNPDGSTRSIGTPEPSPEPPEIVPEPEAPELEPEVTQPLEPVGEDSDGSDV